MTKARGEKLSNVLGKLWKHESGYFFSDWKRNDLAELIITILGKIKFLHEHDILMSDVNMNNILVVFPTEVYFVDTDSYQFDGFPCSVGKVKYNSPEFQEALRGYDYSDILRIKDDELFSVAVLLLELMFIGKWPSARRGLTEGRYGEAVQRKIFNYPLFRITKK